MLVQSKEIMSLTDSGGNYVEIVKGDFSYTVTRDSEDLEYMYVIIIVSSGIILPEHEMAKSFFHFIFNEVALKCL